MVVEVDARETMKDVARKRGLLAWHCVNADDFSTAESGERTESKWVCQKSIQESLC